MIGWAVVYPTYLLLECPTPWPSNAFNAKALPKQWQNIVADIKQNHPSIRPLLVYNEQLQQDCTRVMLWQQPAGWAKGYHKSEFQVANLTDAALLVEDYLKGSLPETDQVESTTRDILVCTHGSHDQCCARYGNPFFRQAIATVQALGLQQQVRIWQSSHFGGHRFAPTIIDFPDGRYYGRLTPEALTTILTRQGDIRALTQVYRGWGILPSAAQVLEQELLLQHGWDWLDYKVACQVLEHNEDESFSRIELRFETPTGQQEGYQAEVITDSSRAVFIHGACDNATPVEAAPYAIARLTRLSSTPANPSQPSNFEPPSVAAL